MKWEIGLVYLELSYEFLPTVNFIFKKCDEVLKILSCVWIDGIEDGYEIHNSKSAEVGRSYSDELGSTEDLSLQCYFWALHARLVGALSFQYPGSCIDVVYFLQQFTVRR